MFDPNDRQTDHRPTRPRAGVWRAPRGRLLVVAREATSLASARGSARGSEASDEASPVKAPATTSTPRVRGVARGPPNGTQTDPNGTLTDTHAGFSGHPAHPGI